MFSNKIKSLNFLKSILPTYSFIRDSKAFWKYLALFQNKESKTVCFISGFHSFSSLSALKEEMAFLGETVWITPDSFFYRKQFQILEPLYFLKKEKDSFILCDKRFLKIDKKLYPLPPKKVEIERFIKSASLKEKEAKLLFPKRTVSFYCKGDSTDHLNSPKHLKSLEMRLKTKRILSIKLGDRLYLWLKEKLDK